MNITRKEDEKKVSGEDSFFDSVKNIITIVLVAFVILMVAVGRDIFIHWQDNRLRREKGKEEIEREALLKEVDAKDGSEIGGTDAVEAEKTEQVENGVAETEEGTSEDNSFTGLATVKGFGESAEADDTDDESKNGEGICLAQAQLRSE